MNTKTSDGEIHEQNKCRMAKFKNDDGEIILSYISKTTIVRSVIKDILIEYE